MFYSHKHVWRSSIMTYNKKKTKREILITHCDHLHAYFFLFQLNFNYILVLILLQSYNYRQSHKNILL